MRSACLCLLAFTTSAVALAQDPPDADLQKRVDALESEVTLLRRQLLSLKAELDSLKESQAARPAQPAPPKRVARPAGPPADPVDMATVYDAMKIKNVKATAPNADGIVTVTYDLENTSGIAITIPLDQGFSRPFRLLGAAQHWIERQGDDTRIPTMSPRTKKEGRRYAAGGAIIRSKLSLESGELVPFRRTIDTKGYPPGKYSYHIEYKESRGEVRQTEAVEFEVP